MRNGVSWEKKEGVCLDEEKEEHGDQWDHIVIDAESKAIISMVCGKRTKENTEELIRDFASRCNEGEPPDLFTTDDYPCYKDAFHHVYGKWEFPERTGNPGRPREAYQTEPEMQYATVKKQRKQGRVVSIGIEQIYGTDRHLNARKARKTLEFSKDNDYHKCHSWFCASYYNFCWDHRSLRVEIGIREYTHRSPMMVLGVTNNIWSVEEMFTYQTIADH